MSALVRRLVVFAGATPNPRLPDDPQVLLVQGVVAIRVDPPLIEYTALAVNPNPDFWDVLVNPNFDFSSYVRLYECEMQDDGSFVVKRDLFGPGDYPHTWAGWPIPGDPPPTQPTGTPQAVPQTVVLSQGERKALAVLQRKKGTK
jgi:hypothetical protein